MIQEAVPSGEFRRKFVISHGGVRGGGSGEAAAAKEEVNESAEERGVELIRVPDCGWPLRRQKGGKPPFACKVFDEMLLWLYQQHVAGWILLGNLVRSSSSATLRCRCFHQ